MSAVDCTNPADDRAPREKPLDRRETACTSTSAETAHQDSVLIAELATVNTLLARYVLRFTDAEANRATPIPVSDEHALANRLAAAADAIRARAQRRDQHERHDQ